MPDADPARYRLNDLKLRWQQDPSSRLFLQLADEYRKLGQLEEAVTALEQGLEHRPNDLSALVALGRGRLDLERVEEAIEPLETVVSRDPTHLVASKLLLEAHLRRGDAEQAGQRLDTYRLLNDRDPELDHLEYRLERLRSESEEAPTAVGTAHDEAAAEEPDEVIVIEPEEALEEPMELMEAAVEEPDLAAMGATVPEPAEATSAQQIDAPALQVEVASPDLATEPFALPGDQPPAPDFSALWEQLPKRPAVAEPFVGLSALDAEQHWQLLSEEGVFAAPVVPAGNGGAIAATAATVAAMAEVAEPPAADAPAESEAVPPEPEAATGLEAAAEPEAAVDHAAAAVAGAAAIAAAAAVTAAAREPEAAEPEEPSIEPVETVAEATAMAEESPEPVEESATATLGALYLKQGHRDEAERIFRQVLEQEPDNRAALEGLERLGKRITKPLAPEAQQRTLSPEAQHRTLSAADLLAVKSASGRIPEGLTAKKVLVLGNYVKHLKAAGPHVS